MTQRKRVEFRNVRSSGKTPSRDGQSRALYREMATLLLSDSAGVVRIQLQSLVKV